MPITQHFTSETRNLVRMERVTLMLDMKVVVLHVLKVFLALVWMFDPIILGTVWSPREFFLNVSLRVTAYKLS